MSEFSYDRARGSVDRACARYGRRVTIFRTPAVGVVQPRNVQLLEVGRVKHVLDGSALEIGDIKFLAPSTSDMQAGDRFDDVDGQSRVIVDPVTPIRPGAVVVGYECYARNG